MKRVAGAVLLSAVMAVPSYAIKLRDADADRQELEDFLSPLIPPQHV
ncbi:hypothetical protein [Hydrogenobacter thermophilus]